VNFGIVKIMGNTTKASSATVWVTWSNLEAQEITNLTQRCGLFLILQHYMGHYLTLPRRCGLDAGLDQEVQSILNVKLSELDDEKSELRESKYRCTASSDGKETHARVIKSILRRDKKGRFTVQVGIGFLWEESGFLDPKTVNSTVATSSCRLLLEHDEKGMSVQQAEDEDVALFPTLSVARRKLTAENSVASLQARPAQRLVVGPNDINAFALGFISLAAGYVTSVLRSA